MNVHRRGRVVAVVLALVGAVAVAGCGSGNTSASSGKTLTKITYRGPFVTNGGDAPFYYAQKLGYYADEGLDVEIRDSKGSSQTIADVGSGGSDYGMATATNLMLAVSQGQPVTSVATPLGKSSFGFFVPKDSGITSISGLAGKSVAATALGGPNMFAALATAGLSKSQVKPVFADASALASTYVSGKVDAVYTSAYLASAVARRPSNLLLQSDGGYNPPDYALVVKRDRLAGSLEQVRGFVRASLRGFQAAEANPQAAIDALLAKHPELARGQALATLKATFSFRCSAAQHGKTYGQNAEADWVTAAKALQGFADLKGSTTGQRFFTNDVFAGSDAVAVSTC